MSGLEDSNIEDAWLQGRLSIGRSDEYRFYTQLVVWTYIVLPAICILLSPTLILGVAKAQHQRAKLMANALAAKSKMAAAVARNNAKLYQRRLTPNHNSHNAHNFFPSAYPQQHIQFRSIRDVSKSSPNWDVSKRSHWDQQDESMGVLQNMWNMNSFGNTQNGGVVRSTRNDNLQLNDAPFEETIVGSPRIYEDHQRKTIERIANTGPLFGGRNVYDEVVSQGNPVNNEIENIKGEVLRNNFQFGNEDFDETDMNFGGFTEDEEEFARHKNHRKNKKGHSNYYYPQYNYYQDEKYKGPDYDFYKRSDADGSAKLEDIISTDPNLKSYLPANDHPEERSKQKRKGHHHHHSYDYTYYGRNNANEELLPEEIIAGDDNLMSSLAAGAQGEDRSSKNKGKGHHHRHVHYDRNSANESPVQVPNMPPTEVQISNFQQNQQVDHQETPIISEDGAILGTFLNLPDQNIPGVDYQKAVEEVEEFNKKLVEATQRLAHPVAIPPSDIFQFAPDAPTFPEPFQPNLMDEKSAIPDPDPHHHLRRGFSHTHTHTHSHELRPLPPPPYPNGGFGLNEFGQHGFGQALANGNAFSNSGFGGPHLSEFGGGFGQAQASAQAQALSKTGFGGGFGNSQANAQAISQSASSGFGGAASQAIAQANAGSHAGPQFFQVLGPSNFVNARSKESVTIPPPLNNDFKIPQLKEFPINNMMHEMESGRGIRFERSSTDDLKLKTSNKNNEQKSESQAEIKTLSEPVRTTLQDRPSIVETLSQNAKLQINQGENQNRSKRFAKPQDSTSDIFSGLNLASGIVHSALDLSSKLPSNRKLVENPSQNNAHTMKSIESIVNSGLGAGKSNTDDQEFETNQNGEPSMQVAPFTDIVNMDLINNGAHKRVHRSPINLDNPDGFQGLNLASGIVQSSVGSNSNLQQSPRQTSESEEDTDGEDLTKELIALHIHRNTSTKAPESDADILELHPEFNKEDDEAEIIEMAKDILKAHEASKQMKRISRNPIIDAIGKSSETQTDVPQQSPRQTSESEEDTDGEDLTKELIAIHIHRNTSTKAPESDADILELHPEFNKEDDEAEIIEMAKDILKAHEASKQMKRISRNPIIDAIGKSSETQTDVHQQSPRQTSESEEDTDGEDLTKELIAIHIHRNTSTKAPESDADILELHPEFNKEDDEAEIIEMAKDILKAHEASKQMKRISRNPIIDAIGKSSETQTDVPCQVMSNVALDTLNKDEAQHLDSNIVGATVISKPDFKEVIQKKKSKTRVKKPKANFEDEMIDMANPVNNKEKDDASVSTFNDSKSPVVLNLQQTDTTKHNTLRELGQGKNDQQVSMMNPDDMNQENTQSPPEAPLNESDIIKPLAHDTFDLHKQIEEIDTLKHMTGGTSFVGLPHLEDIKQMTEENKEKVQMMNPDDFPQINQPTSTEPPPQIDHVTELFTQESLDLHKQFEEADSNKHQIGQTSFLGMPLLKNMNQMMTQDKSDHEIIQMINPDDFPQPNQPTFTELPSQVDHVSESLSQENLDLHKQFEEADPNKHNIGQTSFVGMPLLKNMKQVNLDHEITQMINPDDLQQNRPIFTEAPSHVDDVSESFIKMSNMPSEPIHEMISMNSDDIEKKKNLENIEIIEDFKPSSQENPNAQFEKTDLPNLNSKGRVLGMPLPSESMRDSHSEESKERPIKSNKSSKESSEEQYHPDTTAIVNTSTVVPSVSDKNQDTTLIPDEIEEIQFRIPDEPVMNENTTSGKVEDYTMKVVEPPEASTDSSLTVNATGITEASTKSLMEKADDTMKLNKEDEHNSTNPFASVEEEMKALTDEQKQEFLKQEEQLIADILATAGVNYDGFLKPTQSSQSTKGDQTVASPNLLEAVEDRSSNWMNEHSAYTRNARSPMEDGLDSILGAQREHLSNIKKDATGDDDLLMISFIGDSIIKDLENRRDKVDNLKQRSKREIVGLGTVSKLIANPNTKIDVPKTFDNVGAAVRHTFESPKAPMYHVRNMLGNTKNTIMSAAKIPPNNIIVPSQYHVSKIGSVSEQVGAINQKMLISHSGGENVAPTSSDTPTSDGDSLGIMDTFHKIGGMVKESMDSGKNVVYHANDAASDARNAFYTAGTTVPRLVIPPSQLIATRSSFPGITKPVIISPKILEMKEEALGSQQQHPDQFVGMGQILDAVGITKPEYSNVELQQTLLDPSALRQHLLMQENPSTLDDPVVGQTETLLQAEKSTGAKNLKDFFNKMHQEMKEILTSQHEDRKRIRNEKLQLSKARLQKRKDYTLGRQKSAFRTLKNIPDYDENIDANTELPPEILKVFTDDLPKDFVLHRQADNQMSNAKDKTTLQQRNGSPTLKLQNQNQQNLEEINYPTTIMPPEVLKVFTDDLPKDFVLHRQADNQMSSTNDKTTPQQENPTLRLQNQNQRILEEISYPTTIMPPEVLKVFTDDLPKDFVIHRQAGKEMRNANIKINLQQRNGSPTLKLQNQNQQTFEEFNYPTTIMPPEVLKVFTDDLPKDFVLHRQADKEMRNANIKINLQQRNGSPTLKLQNRNQPTFEEVNYPTTIMPPEVLKVFTDDLPKDFVLHRQADTPIRNANEEKTLEQQNDGQNEELQNQNQQNIEQMNYLTTIIPPKVFTPNSNAKNTENQNGEQTLGLNLAPELMKPFMGQPDEATFDTFLRENGDEVPSMRQSEDYKPKKTLVYPITPLNLNITIPQSEKPLNLTEWLPNPAVANRNPDSELRLVSKKELPILVRQNHPLGGIENEDLGQLLGAKNPVMFEKLFNESLRKKEKKTPSEVLVTKSEPDIEDSEKSEVKDHTTGQIYETPEESSKKPNERTSMVMPKSYKKPFMGHANPKKISDLLNQYNESNSKSDESLPYVDPIKNVVYSSDDNDYGLM